MVHKNKVLRFTNDFAQNVAFDIRFPEPISGLIWQIIARSVIRVSDLVAAFVHMVAVLASVFLLLSPAFSLSLFVHLPFCPSSSPPCSCFYHRPLWEMWESRWYDYGDRWWKSKYSVCACVNSLSKLIRRK